MPLYKVHVSIEDEPAYKDYVVLVAAERPILSRESGRKAALSIYRMYAGGYGTSKAKALVRHIERYEIPEEGVVMVAEA